MRREVKKELVGLMDSMLQLMDVLESSKEKNNFIKQIVSALHIVENYVKEEKNPYLLSLVYKLKNELEKNIEVDKQECFEKLLEIKTRIEEIDTKTKIVFFPYKVQMWGVFHTIYETALTDPDCEVSVVPIPYYTKKKDGKRQFCYEGELFKSKVNIIPYTEYKIEKERPDIVYVHNIYDDCNTITEVEETYFTNNLKKYTRKLVYVPYFVSSFLLHTPEEKEFWFDLPSLQNVDKVILAGTYLENVAIEYGIAQEKILSLGSPKLDTIVQALKETIELPIEWENRLKNRKVVFVNTLYHVFEHWDVIQKILTLPKEDNNLAVIWRPHPLTEAFLENYSPQYLPAYQEVKEIIRQGIDYPYVVLDEEKDYIYALKRAELLVSGVSSLLNSFLLTKKPVIFLGDFPSSSILLKETFEFIPPTLENLEDFMLQVLEEEDEYKKQLREQAYKIYANYDGTCGKKVHQSLMKEIQMENDREDVFEVFEKGDYKRAFFMWKNIYNESKVKEEKETIYQLLKDIYYIPNQQELQRVYYENYSLISQYPFIFGWNGKKWEELEIEIFPLSEEEFCFFHKGRG